MSYFRLLILKQTWNHFTCVKYIFTSLEIDILENNIYDAFLFTCAILFICTRYNNGLDLGVCVSICCPLVILCAFPVYDNAAPGTKRLVLFLL